MWKNKEEKKEWLEVSDSNVISLEEKKPIEGNYLGYKEHEDNFGNNSKLHKLLTSDKNSCVEFWGFTDIDKKLKLVEVGDYVRIEFLGVVKLKDNKTFKKVKVELNRGEKKLSDEEIEDLDIPF